MGVFFLLKTGSGGGALVYILYLASKQADMDLNIKVLDVIHVNT